jgi:hypothetical protein
MVLDCIWAKYMHLSVSHYTLPYQALLYFTISYFCMPYRPDGSTQPIGMLSGSKYAAWATDMPAEGGVDTNLHLEVKVPPKPQLLLPNALFPAKSIDSNNF